MQEPAEVHADEVAGPEAERGGVSKVYVVLAQEYLAGDAGRCVRRPGFVQALVAELQTHVRGKLAPYEYPKDIEFVDALPMTTTGKVQRRLLRLQEEQRAQDQAALG